ncbi:hypothetical protein ACFL1A_01955 [Patescibacteria group bacterium]
MHLKIEKEEKMKTRNKCFLLVFIVFFALACGFCKPEETSSVGPNSDVVVENLYYFNWEVDTDQPGVIDTIYNSPLSAINAAQNDWGDIGAGALYCEDTSVEISLDNLKAHYDGDLTLSDIPSCEWGYVRWLYVMPSFPSN